MSRNRGPVYPATPPAEGPATPVTEAGKRLLTFPKVIIPQADLRDAILAVEREAAARIDPHLYEVNGQTHCRCVCDGETDAKPTPPEVRAAADRFMLAAVRQVGYHVPVTDAQYRAARLAAVQEDRDE